MNVLQYGNVMIVPIVCFCGIMDSVKRVLGAQRDLSLSQRQVIHRGMEFYIG